jgi:O-antigen/teichoic acid export membrane protein
LIPPAAAGADETAALAQGGRTSFFGFLLRLLARLPFLFIAGRLPAYGAEALGRFAYATLVVELMAQLATLGLKRGLAAELAKQERPDGHVVADALLLGWLAAAAGALLLVALPWIVFPERDITGFDRFFPFIALAIAGSDISLAALAFRRDIAATVRARSVVEPWTLSIAALGLGFTGWGGDGLIIAYAMSLTAALAASLWPLWRAFGRPRGWRPHPRRLLDLARANLPLAGADVADWGSRRLDLFILGRFAGPEVIGIYYVAQQVASLPQKLKTSFDPILGPVLTVNLAKGDLHAVAGHVRQIGFWIGAAQLGVVLALGMPGQALMGLFGPKFASGAPVLALLLIVELFAAQAAVAEGALIYIRRHANLLWSAAGIVVQVAVTLLLVQRFQGVGAAAGLACAALFLSIIKTQVLGRVLKAPVSGWRWSLLGAAAPAFAVGLGVQLLPEYVQLSAGVVAILGVFCAIVWTTGFRGPDRLLFKRVPKETR